jgi:hypothetical protein
MSRVNLISNPSFKTNTTGWSALGSGTAIARITTDGFFGSSCLRVTKAAVSSSGTVWDSSTVLASTVYTASLYVKVPVGEETSALTLVIDWYNTSPSLISSTTGALTSIEAATTADGWYRLAVTGTSPSTAATAKIRVVQPTAGNAGELFLVDAALLEQSSYAGQYFDDLTQDEENTKVNNAMRPTPYPNVTGMQLNADVNLNGLVLNTIDEDGIVWVCTGIDGWWGQSSSEVQDLPRGLGDGSYDVVGRYTARQLNLTGVILPPDPSYIDAARNKLVKAIDLVRKRGWLLADESPVKGALVRLSGQPSIEVVNARGRIEFEIGLRAPDPIKYHYDTTVDEGFTKATITAGGSATFNNIGNTDVCVLMTVTGPFTAESRIKNTTNNQTIKMITALSAAGATVGTVTAAERVTVDGVKYATVSLASTYQLAAGDTITIASVGNSFDGTFVVDSVDFASSTTFDVTYIYTGGASDYAYATATGTVTLTNKEFLTLDTYNRDVFLNNNTTGSRQLLDTLIDWIVLQPGNNTITVIDAGVETTGTVEVKFRSGWIG